MLSCFSCDWLCVTIWTAAHQVPVHGIIQARILEWILHGIFLAQWSNPCLLTSNLHWQAGSLPLAATWEAIFGFVKKKSEDFHGDPVAKTVTESKLHVLAALTGQLTERWGVQARNTPLFWKAADREDGRLVQVWMPGSFIERRWGGIEEVKTIILQIFPGMASSLVVQLLSHVRLFVTL